MRKVISNISEFAEEMGVDPELPLPEMELLLQKVIYANTMSGMWFRLLYSHGTGIDPQTGVDDTDADGIMFGCIVEGSNAEFAASMTFPFTIMAFHIVQYSLEKQALDAWREANGVDEG